MFWIKFATCFLLSAVALGQELPAGTVVPVKLSSGLNAKNDKAGKQIEGRVMQEVSLPGGAKISERSRVTAHIVRVRLPGSLEPESPGSSIVLKFDAIEDHGHTIPLTAAALAVASVDKVSQAQSPINSSPDREPMSQWVTRQVGGDVVNRGRGLVASHDGMVGTWLEATSVRIKLTPNPDAGCPGGVGYDREQAVWIFSSAACGTYALGNVKIANSGATAPLGEIVLKSSKNISIPSGSGWLLIVTAQP